MKSLQWQYSRVISKPASHPTENLIPDFCQARALWILAGVMEGVAALYVLLGSARGEAAVTQFVLASLFLQWLGFFSAALLCKARGWLGRVRPDVVFAACWILLVSVTVVLSDVAYLIAQWVQWGALLPDASRWQFAVRNGCVSAIVSLLVLRYFWLRQQSAQQQRAEAEARHDALQARIQPHFLFNTLNSIAALVGVRPHEAETLIEDLAELLRASLDGGARTHPLRDELDLTRAYLRIEQVRLGDKLRIEWQVDEFLLDTEAPLLCVQPLAENAITHGIARGTAPGILRLIVRSENQRLLVVIENPVAPSGAEVGAGHHLSVDNIRQRLSLIHGDRAQLELGENQGVFRATLSLPLSPTA